jgi:hypothetical protein
MAIGEHGLLLEPAVQLAEGELKLTQEFATTRHQQMVGPPVLVLLLKVLLATRKHALLVYQ